MKKKASIAKEKREQLRSEILSHKITYQQIADECEVSKRSVSYFFDGVHYNPRIHQAAIRLLQLRNIREMARVAKSQQLIADLI